MAGTDADVRAAPGATRVAGHGPLVYAVLGLAAVKLCAHLATIAVTPYSVHRDELLYLAMGRYLRLFAMDFPPFIALAANLARLLGGDTLLAIRFFPALAGTALLVLAAVLVHELGGGVRAALLAMLAVLLAPLFLRSASLFQPVVFDQLWWTLALYALLRIGRRGARRDWLLLGVAGGLGLLTKFSIGFIAVGVLVALLATRERRWLRTRWPWLAAATALAIGSPSLIGQLQLGFPVAGQMNDLQQAQLARVTPLGFLAGQALMIGPAVLLALAGLVWLLVGRAAHGGRRAAGVACATALLLLLALQGKPYYAGPLYPLLLAAGAVALERVTRGSRTAAAGAAVLVAVYGALALPLGLPVVPPEPMARYAAWLGLTPAVQTNTGAVLPLPQDYADMLGWEEQVAAVAEAYHALPPSERERAVLIASNYGEAGAIDYFGPRLGLPRAVSPVGSYWFFGPGDLPGDIAVTLGVEPHEVAGFYADVRQVGRVPNPWGVPEQQNTLVMVVRQPSQTLQQIWPQFAGRN